ncbi:unnamed protein product [Acanthosepion pharaonis]|uniref:Uncharacterized protein n=1 Tax=Acanthosepion pharaonis TaxID=158019 RepID=A0A812BRC7_ACAPH|nr:unnamed protein product [Sepia pharaonis]
MICNEYFLKRFLSSDDDIVSPLVKFVVALVTLDFVLAKVCLFFFCRFTSFFLRLSFSSLFFLRLSFTYLFFLRLSFSSLFVFFFVFLFLLFFSSSFFFFSFCFFLRLSFSSLFSSSFFFFSFFSSSFFSSLFSSSFFFFSFFLSFIQKTDIEKPLSFLLLYLLHLSLTFLSSLPPPFSLSNHPHLSNLHYFFPSFISFIATRPQRHSKIIRTLSLPITGRAHQPPIAHHPVARNSHENRHYFFTFLSFSLFLNISFSLLFHYSFIFLFSSPLFLFLFHYSLTFLSFSPFYFTVFLFPNDLPSFFTPFLFLLFDSLILKIP